MLVLIIVIELTFILAKCLTKARREKENRMPNKFIGGYRDFDNDRVQTSVNLIGAATVSDATAIGLNFNAWSAGNEGGQFFLDEVLSDSGVAASSPEAQGALRIVLEMVDDVSARTYKEFIPMPSLSKAADGGTNAAYVVSGGLTMLNPLHADYIAMKAALEAAWQSPEGNTGTLSRGYIEE